MAYLADDLLKKQIKIGHVFYIAKPDTEKFRTRLLNVIGVLKGRYATAKFAETIRKEGGQVMLVSQRDIEEIVDNAHVAFAEAHGLKVDKNGQIIFGRNLSCPCGSGIKFKNCHGKH